MSYKTIEYSFSRFVSTHFLDMAVGVENKLYRLFVVCIVLSVALSKVSINELFYFL